MPDVVAPPYSIVVYCRTLLTELESEAQADPPAGALGRAGQHDRLRNRAAGRQGAGVGHPQVLPAGKIG